MEQGYNDRQSTYGKLYVAIHPTKLAFINFFVGPLTKVSVESLSHMNAVYLLQLLIGLEQDQGI